ALADLADGITDPKKAKDEFIKKLTAKASTPGEKELLASLQATDKPRHESTVHDYVQACSARAQKDNAGIAADVVKYASHLRQVTKLMKVKLKAEQTKLGILDFSETVPVTDFTSKAVSEMKFDPKTCVLNED